MADKIFEPYLMILMRNDLASMTGGRAAAQASHATSRFTCVVETALTASAFEDEAFIEQENVRLLSVGYDEWKKSTHQNFGTAIVVGTSGLIMEEVVEQAQTANYLAETIIDPTYVLLDGQVRHLISIPTCAFIFVNRNGNALYEKLKTLPLY